MIDLKYYWEKSEEIEKSNNHPAGKYYEEEKLYYGETEYEGWVSEQPMWKALTLPQQEWWIERYKEYERDKI